MQLRGHVRDEGYPFQTCQVSEKVLNSLDSKLLNMDAIIFLTAK